MKYLPICLVLLSLVSLSSAQTAPQPASDAAEVSPADTLWKDARAALDARQYQKAQSLFDDFLRRHLSDPRSQEARVYSAICDYNQRRVARALDSFNRVINMELLRKRSSPALLLTLDQLALHHRTEGRLEDWKRTTDQLLEFFPDNPVTIREFRLLARQYLEKGEFSLAAAAYERFETQLNAVDRRNLDLARAMTESGVDGYAIVKSANTQLESNNPELAARLYTEALKKPLKDDEKYEAMTKLGWCLYLRNKEKESEKLWKEVVASAPKGNEWRGKSRWHLVVLNAGQYNDVKKAIGLCEEQAREFDGEFLGQQATFSRAWLLKTEGKWKEAKQGFEDLLEKYPLIASCPVLYRHIEECDRGLSARK